MAFIKPEALDHQPLNIKPGQLHTSCCPQKYKKLKLQANAPVPKPLISYDLKPELGTMVRNPGPRLNF